MKRHQLRVGLDYVRLKPSRDSALTSILGKAASLQGLFEGDPLAVTISQSPQFGGTTRSASVFAQDTVHVNERLNIIYGIRWELTPPTATQMQIPTLSGLWTGSAWTTTHTGNINGTATWPMRYGQFAPRIGLAYRLPWPPVSSSGRAAGCSSIQHLGRPSILSMGLHSIAGFCRRGRPVLRILSSELQNLTGPSQHGLLAPDVREFRSGPYPPLRLPMSYQWKISLEKSFGSRGVGSVVGYLGSASRNLLGNEVYIEPDSGILDRGVTMTQNSSNYQALQSRYSGSLRRNVYVSASYTWSHCIDDGSSDSSIFLIHPDYQLSEARASCNFDVRHAATTALSYQVPRSTSSTHLPDWLSGWTISGIFRARSGFPIDIVSNEQALGQDFDNVGRPNLVPGEPIWITDASVWRETGA